MARWSLSARRVWIEIEITLQTVLLVSSLSARRVWIEITHQKNPSKLAKTSLSARRVWIEIIKKGRARRPGQSRSPQGECG